MKRLRFSLIALAAALPAPSLAQDIALDEIVVTANRVPGDSRRSGVSVSVVTEADLTQRRDQTLAETLAALPGISFVQQGPFGNTGTLRIRGVDGRYLAVLIDGIRVSDPSGTTVSFDFGSLTTADVGRIEVLRGSQSALWGGSAVGGVINITTRAATEDGMHQTAMAEGGSFGTAKLSYGLTQKDDRMEMSFNLSHLRTDGFSAFDGGTEADGARASRLSFTAKYRVSDVLSVGGALLAQNTVQDYDGYENFMLADVDNSQSRRELGARLFAEFAAGSTDHLFEVSAFDIDRTYTQPTGTDGFSGQRIWLGYQGTTVVSDALSLIYGLDWNKESASYTNLPGGVADTRTTGAFAQVLWAPSDSFDLSASVRTDHNSGFGSFQTGRLAAAWRPAEGTTVRAAVASGFRAPSVDERFGNYPGAFPFVGNPNLTPEESLSYEIGIEQAFASGATVSATAFHLEVDNLITYAFGAPSTLENLPGASVRKGLELAATLPITKALQAGLAYTYTDAKRPNGVQLAQVPRHDLTLTLDAELSDRLSAGLQIKHVAGRVDNDPNTFILGAMPDYTMLNAAVNFALTDRADAYLRIENLTDTKYQQISGYAASRRAVYVGVSAKF